MRPFLVAPLLLLVLSGCASPSEDADAPAMLDPDAPFVPPQQGEGGMMPRMRFDADEFDQTANYPGSFPANSPCIPTPFLPCDESIERIDLSSQVPADAPVELTATVRGTDSVYATLEVDGATLVRYSAHANSEQAEVAATVVREAAGTVTLAVRRINLFLLDPTATEVSFDAEVRTAVRPDTLLPFFPVFVALAPGDRIQAMGADSGDIEDLMVVPPGQDPIHQMDNLTFEVTPAMPAGDYIVMVTGAQAMLHGPNSTMRIAAIQWVQGEHRPVASGQPLTWTATVPGVPAYAWLTLFGWEETGASTQLSYQGSFSMTIRQDGTELAAQEQACPLPCGVNNARSISTPLFPEGLRRGELEFEVTSDMSDGMNAYEVIGYIATQE